jgi:hypothetical protein
MWTWLKDRLGLQNWQREDDYLDAIAWAKLYEPPAGRQYALAHDFALWRYGIAREHWNDLDRKADDNARYAGAIVAGAGVLGPLVLRYAEQPSDRTWLLIPAVVIAFLAMAAAIVARRPMQLAIPGNARQFLGFAEDERIVDDQQVRALLGASLHTATVGMRAAVYVKARQVALSSWLLAISLLCLALPVVLAK